MYFNCTLSGKNTKFDCIKLRTYFSIRARLSAVFKNCLCNATLITTINKLACNRPGVECPKMRSWANFYSLLTQKNCCVACVCEHWINIHAFKCCANDYIDSWPFRYKLESKLFLWWPKMHNFPQIGFSNGMLKLEIVI